MGNLIDLQIALFEESNNGIRKFNEELDRETANFVYKEAGQHFHFPVTIIEGNAYATLSILASKFGYSNESGLRNLLDRHSIDYPRLNQFRKNERIKIKQQLNLNPNDKKSALLGFTCFLIAGMKGKGNGAKSLIVYLLRMEREGRISLGKEAIRYKESQRVINDVGMFVHYDVLEILVNNTAIMRIYEAIEDFKKFDNKLFKKWLVYFKLGMDEDERAKLLGITKKTLKIYERAIWEAVMPLLKNFQIPGKPGLELLFIDAD